MPLSLILESYQGRPVSAEPPRLLENDLLWIGRANDNDWVLRDPRSVVSRRHFAIERVADGYRVHDSSSNGVFLNETSRRGLVRAKAPSCPTAID